MKEDEEHRKQLGARFERARSIIGLSRGQAAKPCGLLPRDIAQIEDGTKRFIPTPYLQFLASRIDLNSLFDDRVEVRLRPEEPNVPRVPAVDAILAMQKQIQQVVAPSPVLEALREMQERLAKLEAAQAEKGKGKKAG